MSKLKVTKITLKKVGTKLVATVGRDVLTSKFTNSDAYNSLKEKVSKHNEKPTEKSMNSLVKLLTPKLEEKKAKVRETIVKKKSVERKVAADGAKKSVLDTLAEGVSTMTDEDLKKAASLIAAARKVEEAPKEVVEAPRRTGEYNRS